jgi:hypothetical protein
VPATAQTLGYNESFAELERFFPGAVKSARAATATRMMTGPIRLKSLDALFMLPP